MERRPTARIYVNQNFTLQTIDISFPYHHGGNVGGRSRETSRRAEREKAGQFLSR
jgi:hypothetical protein